MPPKGQRASSGKGKAGDEATEDPLQAVVVADDFETTFSPFTLERPRCLLPLANTPLIEYTLEFLASAGVDEVYIYAGAHVDQVETYINASKWMLPTSPFKTVIFLRCVATSVGDVMRDLDQKHLIAGDFITVSGDVLCNFPIGRALKTHKARREKDKNAIMTMILREVEPSYNFQIGPIVPTFVIDPTKDRCLHYEESVSNRNAHVHIDPEILKNPEIDIRQDLVDCRIDICTPDVLSLWSDNFDNQSPRKDFLYGVLKDYELNGKTFHTYIVNNYYATRARDLSSYARISEDFKNKTVTSLAVDHNVFSGTHYFSSHKGPIRDRDVIMARPRRIDNRSIIGRGTSIGADTVIKKSIIGQRCQIGKNSNIAESYIWDDTTIGSNVRILQAIIGNEAFVGDNCTIGQGALISFGVKIAPGTNVPAGARVTKVQQTKQKTGSSVKNIVGDKGEGFEFHDEDGFDSGSRAGFMYQQAEYADSASTLASDISGPPSDANGSRSQSFATATSDEETTDRFQHDTVTILLQRMEEGKQADDMLSELMGLRFGGGADETQVRKAVAGAIAKRIHSQIEDGVPAADASRTTLNAYKTLIRRSQAEQTTEEQVSFLLDVQRDLSHREEGGKALLFISKDLYDLEVFGEEAFLAWWSNEASSKEPEMAEVRSQTAQFVEWLENAESESEDEDDEDDEEEEEEDEE